MAVFSAQPRLEHGGYWSPATVPGANFFGTDTATFATSNKTAVSLSADVAVNGIVFNPGASAFTISSVSSSSILQITGVGITNNSGITQNFVAADGEIDFSNSATAGSGTFFRMDGAAISGGFGEGRIFFTGNSTADNGAFTNNGGTVSGGSGGFALFGRHSSAGNGISTNNGGTVSGAGGGTVDFQSFSSAGSATLIAHGGLGGADGGSIFFVETSAGRKARLEVFGNGKLDISGHTGNNLGVTIGSIEGNGGVFLGGQNLSVGSNNLSTLFSGVIQDGGGVGGTGGSLTKIGKGKLTLSKGSAYTGGATISSGTLLVKNKTGSATGTGAVQVNGGTLGGIGKISGAVTVGTGSSSGAILLPGPSAKKPGTLTLLSTLTFNSLSTYKCVLSRTTPATGQVGALGVTINSGATFTSNGNNFQANYEGGDGNNLTLTVLP